MIDFLNDLDPMVLSRDLRGRYLILLQSLNGLFAEDNAPDDNDDDGPFDDNGDNEVNDQRISQSDDDVSCDDNSVAFREHHPISKPSTTANHDDADIYEGKVFAQ